MIYIQLEETLNENSKIFIFSLGIHRRPSVTLKTIKKVYEVMFFDMSKYFLKVNSIHYTLR